ncbi:uncharacterized protein MONOS_4047 [Monocercomonoides exilis]|uniref:uncharacterized protein n=1 Tax=Monocercomonoides exilis TaxID=2049356 RepID=UPI00355A74CE|nr:hypothetical protein MONOS_4047 [Monocercomonoides exilis]|eukprot:MONOS_4047.1-p1 / transcript=MONOS_4047.1 / gene=MONOS_4047 / organism=Monocercomonoides_exilis_PA203 / gene_product=unspecified product / transcript_product=unspecified product / location=Mono_scaffold00102:124343-125347(+) / protein_length=239 / sequence_SO=supercontig / SO=protein_coding / is_pseudo=false
MVGIGLFFFTVAFAKNIVVGGKEYDYSELILKSGLRYHGHVNDDDIYWNFGTVDTSGVMNCDTDDDIAAFLHDTYNSCYTIAIASSMKTAPLDEGEGIEFTWDPRNDGFTEFKVVLQCSDKNSTTYKPSGSSYTVTFLSEHGCAIKSKDDPKNDPKNSKKGLSFGSVMLIIFSVLLFLYFAAGIPIWKFALKKEGIEIIPFVGFWKMLPGLVVDGIKFIFSPCFKSKAGYSDIDSKSSV